MAVAARLQIVKSSANDLTTLVPNNHTVEVVDNEDGSYAVAVSLINLAATVKAIVNMDKNLPAQGGELPAIQLSFEMPTAAAESAPVPAPAPAPADSKSDADAPAPTEADVEEAGDE